MRPHDPMPATSSAGDEVSARSGERARHGSPGHAAVAWSEGLLVGPEHLEWNDRRVDRRIHEGMSLGAVGAWGVMSLQAWWDGAAVGLSAIEAVMPSGTRVSAPGDDEVAPLRVDAASCGPDGMVVMLAAALRDELGTWCDPEGWTTGIRSCRNSTSERMDEYEVPVVRRRLRLVHAESCPPGWEMVPVLRLRPPDALRPELSIDESFVPPLIRMGGSAEAGRLLRTICSRLREAATSLASDLGDRRLASLGLEGATALAVQKLCGLNRALGTLEPLLDRPEPHPFDVWRALHFAQAELALFGPTRVAPPVESYRHEAFGEDLRGLVDSIDAMVRTGIRRPFEPLPLACEGGPVWRVVKPSSWLDSARVVLGLRVGEDGPDAARRELMSAKVFGGDDHDVDREALAGLRLVSRERDLTGLPPGHVFADVDLASSDGRRLDHWSRSPSAVVRLAKPRDSACPTFFIQRSE